MGKRAHYAGALAATTVLLLGSVMGCPFKAETFVRHCNTAADCDDGNECTADACTDTVCSNTNEAAHTMCSNGSVCDGMGTCVGCVSDDDCMMYHSTSPVCDMKTQTCVSCHDGMKNGDEAGVDCGGTHCGACQANPCDATNGCGDNTVCAMPENVCCDTACGPMNMKCTACTMKNGASADGTCGMVKLGEDPFMQCTMTGTSSAGGCGATMGACACEDGLQNGMETDMDCGGPQCPGCGGGKKCKLTSDCAIEKPGSQPICTNNGTCCESLCNKSCQSCDAMGQCSDALPGSTDPNMLCPAGTVCGSGSAGCVSVAGSPCNPNFLGADCLSGSCSTTKKTCNAGASGKPCNTNMDCASGNCQSNVCM